MTIQYVSLISMIEAIYSMMQSLQYKEHVVANPRRVRRLALNVKSAPLALPRADER